MNDKFKWYRTYDWLWILNLSFGGRVRIDFDPSVGYKVETLNFVDADFGTVFHSLEEAKLFAASKVREELKDLVDLVELPEFEEIDMRGDV